MQYFKTAESGNDNAKAFEYTPPEAGQWNGTFEKAKVIGTKPAKGATGVSRFPRFEWEQLKLLTTDEYYFLEVATDAGYADIIFDLRTKDTAHDLSQELEPLEKYYWRTNLIAAEQAGDNFVTSIVVNGQGLLEEGATAQYTATVDGVGSFPTDVTWSVSPSSGANISSAGVLQIFPGAEANEFTVTATSVQNGPVVSGSKVIDRPPGSEALDTQWANDFYAATDGDNWIDNTGWNGGDVTLQVGDYTQAPYGLECAEINGEIRITKVDFFMNNCVNGSASGLDAFGETTYDVVNPIPDRFDELVYCTYVNLKGNVLGGDFPQSLSRMPNVEKILIQGRAFIENSDNDFKDPDPQSENHNGKQRYRTENFFSGPFPQDWSECQELMDIEASSMHRVISFTGDIPHSLWALPKIRIVLLMGNNGLSGSLGEVPNPENSLLAYVHIGGGKETAYGGKSQINGSLPPSWGLCPNLHFIRVDNTIMQTAIPQVWKDNMINMRIFQFSGNEGLVDTFPTFLINGNSPTLYYFAFRDTGLYGDLPDTADVDPSPYISIFGLGGTDLTGEVKDWVANIRHVQFRFNGLNFTSLGPKFYDPDAPIWQRIRFWDVSGNNISQQELPDVTFSGVDFEGITQSQNGLTIGIDTDLGVVFSGTVTQTTAPDDQWFRDVNAIGVWPNSWAGYEITLIDPDGIEPNRRYINENSTNWEGGYLYPRGADDLNTGEPLDFTGITGWTYEIRPLALNKIIRFKRGENDFIPRRIVSKTDNTVTIDRIISENVSGLEYYIHDTNTAFLELQTRGNDWIGKIPESYAYIPTERTLSWMQLGNGLLEGEVPDFTNLGGGLGGDANRVYIYNNKFLPRDILPNLAANNTLNVFDYSNQKPFSDNQEFQVSIDGQFIFQDFEDLFVGSGYSFEWRLAGSVVSTDVILVLLSITESDLGQYNLHVTHVDLDGTWISGGIELSFEPEEPIV